MLDISHACVYYVCVMNKTIITIITAALRAEAERGFAFGAASPLAVSVSHTERSGRSLLTRHGEAVAILEADGNIRLEEVDIF